VPSGFIEWPKTTGVAALKQTLAGSTVVSRELTLIDDVLNTTLPPFLEACGVSIPTNEAKIEMLTPKGEHFQSPLFYQGAMFDGRISFDGIAIRQKLW
jgi:hypothetical protein